MKKLMLIVCALSLIFLVSCKISIDKDTDTDKEYLTDFGTNVGKDTNTDINTDTDTNTDTNFDTDNNTDTDTVVDTDTDTDVEIEKMYVITVKDQDGVAVGGATASIYDNLGDVVKELVTNEEGIAVCSLKGSYLVDITSLPNGYIDNSPATDLQERTVITVENKNPNGTENRPYILSKGITEFVLASNEKQYYLVSNGDNQTFLIRDAVGIRVTYGDTVYIPDSDNAIRFVMNNNDNTLIVIENTGNTQGVYAIEVFYQKTDMDKAESIRLHTQFEALVSKDESKYFKWIADRDGMVMAISMSEKNNISLYNKNNDMWTNGTNGEMCEYIYASEGDEIYLKVSSLDEEQITIPFMIYSYDATLIDDSIPLMKKSTSVTLLSNQRFFFVVDMKQGSFSIQGLNGKIYYNNEEYDISEYDNIQMESQGSGMPIFFELENTSEEANTFVITIN